MHDATSKAPPRINPLKILRRGIAMHLAIGVSVLVGFLAPQTALAWDEPPVIVEGNYPECPLGQVRFWFGNTAGPCGFVGGAGGTGSTGGTGDTGSSGGAPGSPPSPAPVPAPNPNDNPEPATCHSGGLARHLHAIHDANELRLAAGLHAGMMVLVTYDDGGTEVWQVTYPTFSDPLSNVPFPGSLQCP